MKHASIIRDDHTFGVGRDDAPVDSALAPIATPETSLLRHLGSPIMKSYCVVFGTPLLNDRIVYPVSSFLALIVVTGWQPLVFGKLPVLCTPLHLGDT